MTDKISKMVGCFKCIEQLHAALAFFVSFLTQKNKYGNAVPMHKSNRVAFAYFMQAQRLLARAFGGCFAWLLAWQVATKRHRLNVGFSAFIKNTIYNYNNFYK